MSITSIYNGLVCTCVYTFHIQFPCVQYASGRCMYHLYKTNAKNILGHYLAKRVIQTLLLSHCHSYDFTVIAMATLYAEILALLE